MGADNFVNSQVAGKRGARRSRVLLAASLETPDGTFAGRLRDLSPKGALVECDSQPAVGTRLVFVRSRTRIPARVAWAAAGRIGLEFDEAIDEHKVLVQLGHGRKLDDPNERYTRSPLGSMSARERKLAKAWGVTVGLTLPES